MEHDPRGFLSKPRGLGSHQGSGPGPEGSIHHGLLRSLPWATCASQASRSGHLLRNKGSSQVPSSWDDSSVRLVGSVRSRGAGKAKQTLKESWNVDNPQLVEENRLPFEDLETTIFHLHVCCWRVAMRCEQHCGQHSLMYAAISISQSASQLQCLGCVMT